MTKLASKWAVGLGESFYNKLIGAGGDYASLAAYLADSPVSGDRLYLIDDETITTKLVIPAGITIWQRKGKKIKVATNIDAIQFGDNVSVEDELYIELSHTGTIANGVIFAGDHSAIKNLILENKSTGTVTNAFVVNSGKKSNYAKAEAYNSSSGSFTNLLIDNSSEFSNDIEVREN